MIDLDLRIRWRGSNTRKSTSFHEEPDHPRRVAKLVKKVKLKLAIANIGKKLEGER